MPLHFHIAASEDAMKRYALIPIFALLLLLSVGCGARTQNTGDPSDSQMEITEPSLRDPQEETGDDKTPEETPPAGEGTAPEQEAGDKSEENLPAEETPDPPGAEEPDPVIQDAPQAGAMVALTFDDGPHAEYTDQILDILEANGAKATFFEVGRNLYNDADAVRRAEALGCEVGSHSYRHADLGKMSAESIAEDLAKADAVFTEVLGHAPTLLRPPYGSMNNAVKYTTGRSVITWSIDTEDWLSRDVDKIMAKVAEAGDLTGQVILMHSNHATSVEAARQLVPQLIEQGYQLVTVSELITQYYGDQVLPNGQEMNDLVIAGRLEPDQDKRVEIYTQLVNLINEEAVSMPLYQEVNTALYRSDLKGVVADTAVPVNRFFDYTY